MFYNIHVSASITAVGRSLISSATMFFEMFLSNNVKFCSLDEIITFINNVITEKDRRIYSDRDILDENISREELTKKDEQILIGIIKEYLLELSGKIKDKKILVVGLGNNEVTPDSLGPSVAKRLNVTRHLK